jgi:hypothetical protein
MTATATAPFAPLRFDNASNSCQSYFSLQGYEVLANAFDGARENGTLGADFCISVDAEARRKGNASVGLKSELDMVWTKHCLGYSVPVQKSGARGLLLMRSGNVVLVSTI